jgi:hypothetical protein
MLRNVFKAIMENGSGLVGMMKAFATKKEVLIDRIRARVKIDNRIIDLTGLFGESHELGECAGQVLQRRR